MTARKQPRPRRVRGTERDFQTQVMQLARYYGWNLVYHTHDSRRSQPGFPDLVLLRPPEALFWELKGPTTRIRPEQVAWVEALQACGLEAGIYRPADFDLLHERLARGRHRTEPLHRPAPGQITVDEALEDCA